MLRYDKCVYWPPIGKDDFGQMVFGPPEEISCRWEDTLTELMDKMGNRIISTSMVYVSKDVALLGVLWHGKFTNIQSIPNPLSNADASEIRMFKRTPNLRNKEILRIAYL